jgi:(2Fe-2S) ferredoxin
VTIGAIGRRAEAKAHFPATTVVFPDRIVVCLSLCEFVPDAVYSQHVFWIARIRFQLAPQILDVSIDGSIE